MIGKNVTKFREALSISQRELGRRVGISGQMISKIENELTNPSIETLNKIAEVLGVPLNALLDNEESIDVTESDKDTIEFLDNFSFDNPKVYDVVTFLKKFDYITKAKPYEDTYLISIYKDKKLLVTVEKSDFEEQSIPLIKLAQMAQNKADSFVKDLNFLCGFHSEE